MPPPPDAAINLRASASRYPGAGADAKAAIRNIHENQISLAEKRFIPQKCRSIE